jgi:hypothetical protein
MYFQFPFLVTSVIYIVNLTAAELLIFKTMPRCRFLEPSCAALSLDTTMLIAELHNTEDANPKAIVDHTNASYPLDHHCFFHKSEVQLEARWCFAASSAGSSALGVGWCFIAPGAGSSVLDASSTLSMGGIMVV